MATSASSDNNGTSKSWRIRLAEKILPFRFILLPILIAGLWPGLIPDIPTTEPTIPCKIPDVCNFGYDPSDVLNWYEFIGSDGRLVYLGIVAFDLFFILPLYSGVLYLELYLALPDHLSDTLFSCIPFIATGLDIIETNTHGYGTAVVSLNLRSFLLPKFWLGMVSICTVTKFATIAVTVLLIFVFRILKLFGVWAKPKEE